jgi:hypothetical protein
VAVGVLSFPLCKCSSLPSACCSAFLGESNMFGDFLLDLYGFVWIVLATVRHCFVHLFMFQISGNGGLWWECGWAILATTSKRVHISRLTSGRGDCWRNSKRIIDHYSWLAQCWMCWRMLILNDISIRIDTYLYDSIRISHWRKRLKQPILPAQDDWRHA